MQFYSWSGCFAALKALSPKEYLPHTAMIFFGLAVLHNPPHQYLMIRQLLSLLSFRNLQQRAAAFSIFSDADRQPGRMSEVPFLHFSSQYCLPAAHYEADSFP